MPGEEACPLTPALSSRLLPELADIARGEGGRRPGEGSYSFHMRSGVLRLELTVGEESTHLLVRLAQRGRRRQMERTFLRHHRQEV